MRVDEMLKDYKEWGKGDLGAIVRAAKFVEDQNQDLHDTLAQVTEENGRLREAMQVADVDQVVDQLLEELELLRELDRATRRRTDVIGEPLHVTADQISYMADRLDEMPGGTQKERSTLFYASLWMAEVSSAMRKLEEHRDGR